MSLVLGRLYIALRAAEGIGVDRAREAAAEVTGLDDRLIALERQLAVVKAMLAVNLVLTAGLLVWVARQLVRP